MDEFSVSGREVEMFRCHIDPMIGPKPRQAFMPKDINARAYIDDKVTGIIMKLHDGTEHFIFGSNVQSTRLKKLEPVEEIKRRPGKQSQAV